MTDKAFILQLRMKGEQKAKEYAELLRYRQSLEMKIARTKIYVEQLNEFLVSEGMESVPIEEIKQNEPRG
ncbi:MAG TPA: hypothetical protein VMW91_04920 [Desulfosporosinus sp.]|nr:hypothetical protein [Desulfosporosinus sp.]